MNLLDYSLLGVLLLFLIYGYYKGFFRQVLLIVGIGVSFFLAAKYHTTLAETDAFSGIRERNANVALVASFIGIFFVAAALTSIIATLIGRRITSLQLRSGDRWLGALVGLAMGVLLLGGLAVGLREWVDPEGAVGTTTLEDRVPEDLKEKTENLVAGSVLVPHLADACLILVGMIPQEGREELTKLFKEGELGKGETPGGTPNDLTKSLTNSLVEGAKGVKGAEGAKERAPLRLLNLGARRRVVKEMSGATPTPAAGKESEASIEPAIEKGADKK